MSSSSKQQAAMEVRLGTILRQADQFGLPLRIAAWVVLAAQTEGREWQHVHPRKMLGMHPLIPDTLLCTVENYIYDIQKGHRTLTPELRKLAQQLDPAHPLRD